MIRINLLPYRVARRQQQIMQHVAVFVAVLVLAVVLVFGAQTMASMQLSDLKDQTAQLKQQNADLKKKIGKIENLDALRADVERKLKIVDQLQEGRFRSLMSLNGIAEAIPANIWLKQIKDKGDSIQLNGYGESNQAVADFMRKLDRSELFEDIRLGGISRTDVDGLPMRRFTLAFKRVGDTPADSDAPTGKRRSK